MSSQWDSKLVRLADVHDPRICLTAKPSFMLHGGIKGNDFIDVTNYACAMQYVTSIPLVFLTRFQRRDIPVLLSRFVRGKRIRD